MTLTEDLVLDRLKEVIDPEVGLNIVDLGLIYGLHIGDDDVLVKMTLTTPGCPMGQYLTGSAEAALRRIPGLKTAEIELVWSPPWTPDRINPDATR